MATPFWQRSIVSAALLLATAVGLSGCDIKQVTARWQELYTRLDSAYSAEGSEGGEELPPEKKTLKKLQARLAELQTQYTASVHQDIASVQRLQLKGQRYGLVLQAWLYGPMLVDSLKREQLAATEQIRHQRDRVKALVDQLTQAIADGDEIDLKKYSLPTTQATLHKPAAPHLTSGSHGGKAHTADDHSDDHTGDHPTSAPDTPKDTRPVIVLLHGLGQSHADWGDFPFYLSRQGFIVLALDLPGHGLSTVFDGDAPKTLDWRLFTELDWPMVLKWTRDGLRQLPDNEMAKRLNLTDRRVVWMGTGFGSLMALNLTLLPLGEPQHSTSTDQDQAAVLLSPPVQQKGYEGLLVASDIDHPVWIGVSQQTTQEAMAGRKYCRIIPGRCTLAIFPVGEVSGMHLLKPQFSKAETYITNWLLTWRDGVPTQAQEASSKDPAPCPRPSKTS